MKSISLIAFVSCIFLLGCSFTGGTLYLKGKIIDKSTGIAIANRRLIIITLVKNDGRFVPDKVVGHFISNSSGQFEYALKKTKNIYLYDFYFTGDSIYAPSHNRLGLTELHRDNKFLSFSFDKLTDFSIKIERTSKIPARDTLYISWRSNGKDGKALFPYKVENNGYALNSRLEWIGGKVKSVLKTKVYADKKTIVRFKLFREGRYTVIVDTIFCERDVDNHIHFKY